MLISNPSHSFWIVATPALFVLPFTMSLTVDCVTPGNNAHFVDGDVALRAKLVQPLYDRL